MWKIETDRRVQGDLMWLLKSSGAEKKQLQEHEPLQPEGASLESPGTAGTTNGRDRQTDRGIDGADRWRDR